MATLFCFRSLPNRNIISLHEVTVLVVGEILLNAMSYIQNPTIKSDFENSQSWLDGKLYSYSLCRTGFQLSQGTRGFKTSDLSCLS